MSTFHSRKSTSAVLPVELAASDSLHDHDLIPVPTAAPVCCVWGSACIDCAAVLAAAPAVLLIKVRAVKNGCRSFASLEHPPLSRWRLWCHSDTNDIQQRRCRVHAHADAASVCTCRAEAAEERRRVVASFQRKVRLQKTLPVDPDTTVDRSVQLQTVGKRRNLCDVTQTFLNSWSPQPLLQNYWGGGPDTGVFSTCWNIRRNTPVNGLPLHNLQMCKAVTDWCQHMSKIVQSPLNLNFFLKQRPMHNV